MFLKIGVFAKVESVDPSLLHRKSKSANPRQRTDRNALLLLALFVEDCVDPRNNEDPPPAISAGRRQQPSGAARPPAVFGRGEFSRPKGFVFMFSSWSFVLKFRAFDAGGLYLLSDRTAIGEKSFCAGLFSLVWAFPLFFWRNSWSIFFLWSFWWSLSICLFNLLGFLIHRLCIVTSVHPRRLEVGLSWVRINEVNWDFWGSEAWSVEFDTTLSGWTLMGDLYIMNWLVEPFLVRHVFSRVKFWSGLSLSSFSNAVNDGDCVLEGVLKGFWIDKFMKIGILSDGLWL